MWATLPQAATLAMDLAGALAGDWCSQCPIGHPFSPCPCAENGRRAILAISDAELSLHDLAVMQGYGAWRATLDTANTLRDILLDLALHPIT